MRASTVTLPSQLSSMGRFIMERDVDRKAEMFVDQPRSASVQRDIDRILKAELRSAFRAGAAWKAQDVLGRLLTLKANTRNEKLSAESFRDVATGIIDDLVADLQE